MIFESERITNAASKDNDVAEMMVDSNQNGLNMSNSNWQRNENLNDRIRKGINGHPLENSLREVVSTWESVNPTPITFRRQPQPLRHRTPGGWWRSSWRTPEWPSVLQHRLRRPLPNLSGVGSKTRAMDTPLRRRNLLCKGGREPLTQGLGFRGIKKSGEVGWTPVSSAQTLFIKRRYSKGYWGSAFPKMRNTSNTHSWNPAFHDTWLKSSILTVHFVPT